MAGKHRHHRPPKVVRDPDVFRCNDEDVRYPIHHLETVPILEIHEVTDLETIQVCKRAAISGAVSGKNHVPAFARGCRASPMGDTLVDHRQGDPGTNLFIHADRWDPKVRDHHTRLLARRRRRLPTGRGNGVCRGHDRICGKRNRRHNDETERGHETDRRSHESHR